MNDEGVILVYLNKKRAEKESKLISADYGSQEINNCSWVEESKIIIK